MKSFLTTDVFNGIALVHIVIVLGVFFAANWLLTRYFEKHPALKTRKQVLQAVLLIVALVSLLVVAPIGDTRRGQLLSLLGILLSAAIALSSTTVLGNAMAGLMLRSIQAFRPGSFVRIGDEYFGRVTEMDLLHTEIQTEERDLMTFSNLYLITNPFKVIRDSGTILHVEVTLGYDVPRRQVRELLLAAATKAELEEPFVQVRELGDYSVCYRISGVLTDISRLISARSRLRETTLDALHEGGVEIVSPTFMNTRALTPDARIIPVAGDSTDAEEAKATPDAVVFDKANEAATIEQERASYEQMQADIAALQQQLKAAPAEQTEALKSKIATLTEQADAYGVEIENRMLELKADAKDDPTAAPGDAASPDSKDTPG